ncbi:hypothetical protein [Polyangium aurulentum]|uniref:hypothetical protein n=1 Tax=Polyangium aurulentum TaxID=2567896 RepID=UPI0010AECBBF|nr:hypothetical protein [Polyangium aurulentum]UQA60172.1 hypothetical protein E8A73_006740 [Polyangium aurulentum]
MRDHEARVEAFGRTFVLSVAETLEDDEAVVRYVERRFGRSQPPRARCECPFARPAAVQRSLCGIAISIAGP